MAYGRCPDRRSAEYILSEKLPAIRPWPKFYEESSRQLRVSNKHFECSESCFCMRLALAPGKLAEQRSFEFHDVQARPHAACVATVCASRQETLFMLKNDAWSERTYTACLQVRVQLRRVALTSVCKRMPVTSRRPSRAVHSLRVRSATTIPFAASCITVNTSVRACAASALT